MNKLNERISPQKSMEVQEVDRPYSSLPDDVFVQHCIVTITPPPTHTHTHTHTHIHTHTHTHTETHTHTHTDTHTHTHTHPHTHTLIHTHQLSMLTDLALIWCGTVTLFRISFHVAVTWPEFSVSCGPGNVPPPLVNGNDPLPPPST